MKKIERLKKKYNNFLYDHIYLKRILNETNGVLCGLISALLYAFGFACFISSVVDAEPFNIVTGGVSGLTQNIALIIQFSIPNVTITAAQVQAIGYTCFNIPLLIFAFFKIGKRFAIQTAINVVFSSVFLWLLTEYGQDLIHSVVESPMLAFKIGTDYQSIVIVRALFAGICTGFSSAIAFKGDLSCGGIDIVT